MSENDAMVSQHQLRSAQAPGWVDGSAEPWVADVLAALLIANGTKTAIEVGGFRGYTSAKLYKALNILPWPTTLTVCEIDPDRAELVRAAIAGPAKAIVNNAKVVVANSLEWIPTLADESVDFVWLDGNHELPHVAREVSLLLPKLAAGGIIAAHDVFGICDLQRLFNNKLFTEMMYGVSWPTMSLDLPRLGPAGGVGIIQRPR